MAGQYHHGKTPAAWTAVIIAFVGFGLGSYFTLVAQPWGVAASFVVLLLAAVVGGVMRAMGLGQEQAPVRVAKPAIAAQPGPADEPATSAAGEQRQAAATS
ncbi:HGxxPAAW family protein [Streptomyces triticirhizae]|uniref:HGxxPAAW family protein n=1 Tax=Streptomyces triticirhizae TaxID=2483353 RepID=UPI001F30E96C|nr:HGxxPAAW family protein [Streptomyces triticirhizae]